MAAAQFLLILADAGCLWLVIFLFGAVVQMMKTLFISYKLDVNLTNFFENLLIFYSLLCLQKIVHISELLIVLSLKFSQKLSIVYNIVYTNTKSSCYPIYQNCVY